MGSTEFYSAIRTQKQIIRKIAEIGISVPASADVEYAGGEFGRDSISEAEGNLLFDPDIAFRIILARAGDQGVIWNYPDATHPSTEEQPGRIIHEKRNSNDDFSFLRSHFTSQEEFDEFKRKNRAKSDKLIQQWGEIYYGSVDATPKYVTLIRDYILTTGDNSILNRPYRDKLGSKKTIYESVMNAADWVYNNALYGPNINIYDGQPHEEVASPLLRFKRLNGLGIENQVMMDSRESFVFPDGREADHDHPIADIGTQAKAYDALLYAAELLEKKATSDDERNKAARYRNLAKEIQTNTLLLWQEDQQYFAMGEDSSGPIRTKCANVAELMNSSIFDNLQPSLREKYISGIVHQLFGGGMYTVVGTRMKDLEHRDVLTVDDNGTHVIFDAYHDATAVWIEMSHEIVRGLQRQGLDSLAKQVMFATIDGANVEGKPTEFFRVSADGKVLYNQKQHITQGDADFYVTSLSEEVQTWSNSTIIEFKTQLGAQGNRAKYLQNFPKADIAPWQVSLQDEIILSLRNRGLYKENPMTKDEIMLTRLQAPHLTINIIVGKRAEVLLHQGWENNKILN